MALFKKRSNDTDHLNQLRAEIAAMAARLDAADAAKADLDDGAWRVTTRLEQPSTAAPPPPPPPVAPADIDVMRARIQRLYDRLDDPNAFGFDPSTVGVLEARVGDLSAQLSAALLAESATVDPVELAGIRMRLDAVSNRLDELAAGPAMQATTEPAGLSDEFAALRDRVDAISARLDAPMRAPPPPPPVAPAAPVETAQLDGLRERIEQLHDRIAEIDVRITSISTELANQITELSTEIGTIQTAGEPHPDADVANEEIIEELRDIQVKLANEQARYQIAFRMELAALAERLRRA